MNTYEKNVLLTNKRFEIINCRKLLQKGLQKLKNTSNKKIQKKFLRPVNYLSKYNETIYKAATEKL